MRFTKTNRRRFLLGLLVGLPAVTVLEARWFEPRWLKVSHLSFSSGRPSLRCVHFTDLHHKGDVTYLDTVVRNINAQSPDFVCFTGDLVEDAQFLAEALAGLREIKAPLYGIPGNHDYWSRADFKVVARAFEATGGRWLIDENVVIAGGKVNLIGATCSKVPSPALRPTAKNIMLIHYPQWIEKLAAFKFDLALAGHSHGGQVRIPFYGPIVETFGVGRYDLGLFKTASGPFYVGAGIGWFYLPVRLNCRPEITVFEM